MIALRRLGRSGRRPPFELRAAAVMPDQRSNRKTSERVAFLASCRPAARWHGVRSFPGFGMQYRHILHATDFSRASAAAFRHAVTLARQHRAALTLVHAVPEVLPVMATPEIGAATSAETYEALRAAARRD